MCGEGRYVCIKCGSRVSVKPSGGMCPQCLDEPLFDSLDPAQSSFVNETEMQKRLFALGEKQTYQLLFALAFGVIASGFAIWFLDLPDIDFSAISLRGRSSQPEVWIWGLKIGAFGAVGTALGFGTGMLVYRLAKGAD